MRKQLANNDDAHAGEIRERHEVEARVCPRPAWVVFVIFCHCVAAGHLAAQTFTVLHNFPIALTNSDGSRPVGLILSGKTLYGAAGNGGTNRLGTLFALNTDASDFTVLHSFTGSTNDGADPKAAMILSGNSLIGTTLGTVFTINTNGSGFTNVYSFTDYIDRYNSSLVLSGGTVYGTTATISEATYGVVYAVNTDGTGFTVLHAFGVGNDNAYAGLVLSGNTLYGTTYGDGSARAGSVFAINTDGTCFSNLYSFTAGAPNTQGYGTNSDGNYSGLSQV